MPIDFSDSEIFEFASRVLNVLDLQVEYFASKDRTLLGECRFQETEQGQTPNEFFHRKLIPLRQVVLEPEVDGELYGGCSAGMCY